MLWVPVLNLSQLLLISSFADEAPLLPSGFCIIPLDFGCPNRTLDLASALKIGPAESSSSGDNLGSCGSMRSVMIIAFQFVFESHLQENAAPMARQFIALYLPCRGCVGSTLLDSHAGLRPPPGTLEPRALACWICHSYRI